MAATAAWMTTGRRTVALAVLVAAAGGVLLLVDAPETPRPRDQTSGPRVVPIPEAAVTGLEIRLAGGHARAVRTAAGWDVDGMPAGDRLREAVDDLVGGLVALRAVDRFRAPDDEPFGLDAPIGRLTVASRRRTTDVVVGGFNAARSAVYARRDGRPHVLLLGAHLLAAMDRVFYHRHVERGGSDVPAPAQRPEIG